MSKIISVTTGTPDLSPALNVFNLYCETGDDPERVAREIEEEKRKAEEAAAYQRRMQLRFEDCPGLIGADAPLGPGCVGRVVINPADIGAAMHWLRRRFVVEQNLELSTDNGLCVDIRSKVAPVKGGNPRPRQRSGRLEQFELPL